MTLDNFFNFFFIQRDSRRRAREHSRVNFYVVKETVKTEPSGRENVSSITSRRAFILSQLILLLNYFEFSILTTIRRVGL